MEKDAVELFLKKADDFDKLSIVYDRCFYLRVDQCDHEGEEAKWDNCERSMEEMDHKILNISPFQFFILTIPELFKVSD
jgi:hypothetical protein